MKPEEEAREKIDELLRSAGWVIQDYKDLNLGAAVGVVVREFPLKKDSADYALIRLLVENTDKAIDILSKGGYIFDIMPVIALEIENKPGTLAEMARKFGEEGININYVYGSALPGVEKSLFIFCPEDIELAARIFKD